MNILIVSFGEGRDYEFHASDDELAAIETRAARQWFDREFVELECTPTNPMGKLLIVDQILNVGKYGGEARFAQPGDWAVVYARNTLKIVGRPHVRVDTAGWAISY
ncbi:hypothetical protein GCM10025771_40690 [Niveibacterium umoris]|uniref:Uncharacterized protein n=1 Tax=Niveibacterium umoris TaxID=1193620 RepID=A0A840BGD0_9RHOO|nr:hypothetical protein [Niveibacterium umoris]MBB4010728.1 hypothetical protein [Niveibacterium umoris]